jgi:Uma2 family endonuclease
MWMDFTPAPGRSDRWAEWRLQSRDDDGIVVVEEAGVTTDEYLDSEETTRHVELAWGEVHEAAPNWDHQMTVGHLFARLDAHVRRFGLGHVGLAPIDVILDGPRNIVVQPDILFVAPDRCDLIRKQFWGAPNLVVEVLSPDTRRHDRTEKRQWYAEYGVQELWLVDPREAAVAVGDPKVPANRFATYFAAQMVRSRVLPRLRLRAAQAFS